MHVTTTNPRSLRGVLPLSVVALAIRVIVSVAGFLACMTLADIKAFGMLPNGPEMKPLVAHTSWTGRDGAPGNIVALAQTGDGYLWLGTPLGLYRFDGLQFTKYPVTAMEIELPSSDVEALCPDSQGGLWIGFRTGGISHLAADGHLANYNLENGLGPNSVLSLVLRSDNSIWAIGDGELLEFRAGQWENFGAKHGLPSDKLFSLFFDRSGNLWTSARRALFVLREDNPEFKLYSKQTFVVADFAEMPNGQLWISDAWRSIRPLNADSPPLPIATKSYTRILIEPSGTLWMAADYRGVSHIQLHQEPHAREKIVQESGLTSEQTDSLIRDRDGNIWVGTSRGLDRFREVSVKILSNLRVEYYPSLARDPAGNVWIAALAHPLIRAVNSSLSKFGPNVGSSPIVCDQKGRVWLVDPMRNALMRLDHGTVFQASVPPEVHHNDANSIGLDRNGAILVSFEGSGLWRYDGSWSRIKDMSFPTEDPLTIFLDQANNLWLGFQAGGIVMQDERGYHSFADGLDGNLGNVLTFGISHNKLWAAGANGIAYFDKGSFHCVTFQGGRDLLGISGVVEDEPGNLWLNASTGIVRIPSSELSSMLLGKRSALDYDEFNERQGVIGTATQMKPTPSAVADKNGTLWFATSGNVFEVSPSSLSVGQKHPILSIQDVLLNGKVAMDREHGPIEIKSSTDALSDLEIDYVGIDLTSPERVTYKYMLEGEDKNWRMVGARRQAFYSHLRPGRYRFRVLASNGGDQWTELATPLALNIAPAFYQTSWFFLGCGLVTVALLYILYLLRVQVVTHRIRERMKERSSERLRIARDLHDTLLQAIHGLVLRIHFAKEALPSTEPVRESLQEALVRADAAILEGRRRVQDLRDEIPDVGNLAAQIARIGEELEIQRKMAFRITEAGQRQDLDLEVQRELCLIAREALTNTLRHSKAKNVEILLTYSATIFIMRCIDTGVGVEPSVLTKGNKTGHWGLVGMRERAESIQSTIQVWSSPRGGTEIEIRVPARKAYRSPRSKWMWFQQLLQLRQEAEGDSPASDGI